MEAAVARPRSLEATSATPSPWQCHLRTVGTHNHVCLVAVSPICRLRWPKHTAASQGTVATRATVTSQTLGTHHHRHSVAVTPYP